MNKDNYTKQALLNEMDGGSVSVHHLLTADEFIAQMEPRIRGLFKIACLLMAVLSIG